MKKPSNTLKTLLWVNELKETKAREEFQKAKRALLELEEMLAEVSKRPRKLYDEIKGQVLSGEDLRAFSYQVSQLLKEKEQVEKILAAKEKEVERLRREAINLHQRRKMAEILWERAKAKYLRELIQEEYKNLEDQILMRRQHEGF